MSNAMQLEHGDWELRLGDCLDPITGLASLADGCADHAITDPPYEAEAHTKARRTTTATWRQTNSHGKATEDYEIDFQPIDDVVRIAAAADMKRAATGWIIAFCQVEAVDKWRSAMVAGGAKWRRAMAWVKPDGTPQLTGDRPAQGFECIAAAWSGDGRSRWNAGGKRGTYEFCVNDFGRLDRPHPTTKPLALMEALVRDFTDPGDLILDPFAGSGTTGVACRRLGRRFLGWERDPKFHAAAMKRIGAAREQLGLLSRAKAPKVEQGDMFKAAKVRL